MCLLLCGWSATVHLAHSSLTATDIHSRTLNACTQLIHVSEMHIKLPKCVWVHQGAVYRTHTQMHRDKLWHTHLLPGITLGSPSLLTPTSQRNGFSGRQFTVHFRYFPFPSAEYLCNIHLPRRLKFWSYCCLLDLSMWARNTGADTRRSTCSQEPHTQKKKQKNTHTRLRQVRLKLSSISPVQVLSNVTFHGRWLKHGRVDLFWYIRIEFPFFFFF